MLPRRTEKTICSPLSISWRKMNDIAPEEKTGKLPLENTSHRAPWNVLRGSRVHRPLVNEAVLA